MGLGAATGSVEPVAAFTAKAGMQMPAFFLARRARRLPLTLADSETTMDADRDSEQAQCAMRDFALACRAERDRRAEAWLDAGEERLRKAGAEAVVAQLIAARLLDRLRR
jgi:hypothetical protein